MNYVISEHRGCFHFHCAGDATSCCKDCPNESFIGGMRLKQCNRKLLRLFFPDFSSCSEYIAMKLLKMMCNDLCIYVHIYASVYTALSSVVSQSPDTHLFFPVACDILHCHQRVSHSGNIVYSFKSDQQRTIYSGTWNRNSPLKKRLIIYIPGNSQEISLN